MKRAVLAGILVGTVFGLVGCSDSPTDTGGDDPQAVTTCLGCHSSEANLKASMDPEKVDRPLMLTGDG
jgi:hypothetical protein